jgi:hypothetical protein
MLDRLPDRMLAAAELEPQHHHDAGDVAAAEVYPASLATSASTRFP